MGYFDTIKNAVNQSMGVFRDKPEPNPMTAQAAVASAPAVAVQNFRQMIIDDDDFVTGEPWRANSFIRLASFPLPEGVEWRIPSTLPDGRGNNFFNVIKTVARYPGLNNAGGNRAVVLPVVGALQQTSLSKLINAAAINSTYHPEVQVWADVAGIPTRCVIVSINYGTGTITYTEPANVPVAAGSVRVYYVSNSGDWRYRIQREQGAIDTNLIGVANNSFARAHAADQKDRRSALYWPQDTQLLQKQSLVLEVNSPLEVVWNQEADHLINITAYRRELEIFDDAALARQGEMYARRGA